MKEDVYSNIGNHKKIVIDGEEYSSQTAVAEMLGVAPSTVAKNVNDCGGDYEATCEYIKSHQIGNHEKIVIEGKEYPSQRAVAKMLGVSQQTLARNVKKYGSYEAVYKAIQNQKIIIEGKEYPSQTAVAEMLGVHPVTLAYHVKKHGSLEAACEYIKTHELGNYKKIVIDGKEYRSQRAVAEMLGVPSQTLGRYLKKFGGDYEATCEYIKSHKIGTHEKIVINGKEYSSQQAVAEMLGVAPSHFCKILKKFGGDYEATCEYIKSHKKQKFTYLGKPYAMIKDLANETGIDYRKLLKAITKCDGNAEKAIMMIKTKERRKNKVLTKDGYELSLPDLATILGLKQAELKSCLDRGMNIDQIKKDVSGKKANRSIRGTGSSVLMYDEKTSLAEYCIKNKLNYSCIYRAITEYGKTIPEAINHYRMNGQEIPTSWIHERYDVLLKHMLLDAQIDYEKVITAMRKNLMPLREALEYVIVRDDAIENDLDPEWQHEIYSLYTDTGLSGEERQECVKAFYITPEEIKVIEKSKENVDRLERQLDLYEIAESIRDQLFTEAETAELMKLYKISDQELKTIFYDFYVKFQNGVLQTDKRQEELKNSKSLKSFAAERIDRYAKLMKYGPADSKEEMTQSPLKNGEEDPHH